MHYGVRSANVVSYNAQFSTAVTAGHLWDV